MMDDNRMMDMQSFVQWLGIMADGMGTHRGDSYFEGAAKSYSIVMQVIQSGVFDTRLSTETKG